jgi:hypothetical protein
MTKTTSAAPPIQLTSKEAAISHFKAVTRDFVCQPRLGEFEQATSCKLKF